MKVEHKDVVELARVLCALDSDIIIPEDHYMVLAERAIRGGYRREKVKNEEA